MIHVQAGHHDAWAVLATAVALTTGVAGCDTATADRLRTCQQQVDALGQENLQLERKLLAGDARISDLQEQVQTLQGLGPERLNALFVVDRLELGSLTGGADYDGVPGDDGVTVYLRPLDADGHVLKAAGEIIVELLDTGVPGSPRSLGQYVYNDPSELGKLWHGRFLTDHYTIRCPWDPATGPPTRREVVINVTFYDFLTGKRLTATRAVTVELPDAGDGAE